MPRRGRMDFSRSRSAESVRTWASAASGVSTPRRCQTKASFLIWDILGLRPGPYFRSVSSIHHVVSRSTTSAGRAR